MLVTFWGVRGSYPIARRDNVGYGGNSTCIQIQAQGQSPLIIDGGSGLRVLGGAMQDGPFGLGHGHANFLITHTHWDHILGYPFFGPFYQAGNQFDFYSAGQSDAELPGILAGQHKELHFPVPFESLKAQMRFKRIIPGQPFEVGGYHIYSIQLNHPGITLGYRISLDEASVVIFTDTARYRQVLLGDGMVQQAEKLGLTKFQNDFHQALLGVVKGADLLIHDSHFLEQEIVGKEHWGHSTADDALALAQEGKVRHLMLFHHAPEHSDEVVNKKLADTRALKQNKELRISAAMEGMAIEIKGKEGC